MWFDVEQRYKTITTSLWMAPSVLWFDVEQRYKTIYGAVAECRGTLWFDVEQRYKTMMQQQRLTASRCGLM